MPLPLVFRRVARFELGISSVVENKRARLGRGIRIEIEKQFEAIANQPQRFRQIRGRVRRQSCNAFPIPYISYQKSTG